MIWRLPADVKTSGSLLLVKRASLARRIRCDAVIAHPAPCASMSGSSPTHGWRCAACYGGRERYPGCNAQFDKPEVAGASLPRVHPDSMFINVGGIDG